MFVLPSEIWLDLTFYFCIVYMTVCWPNQVGAHSWSCICLVPDQIAKRVLGVLKTHSSKRSTDVIHIPVLHTPTQLHFCINRTLVICLFVCFVAFETSEMSFRVLSSLVHFCLHENAPKDASISKFLWYERGDPLLNQPPAWPVCATLDVARHAPY